MKTADLQLRSTIDPKVFAKQILALSGFNSNEFNFEIEPSSSAEFFMGSLHLESLHLIGHGNLSTLFGRSLLAHEIGHATRPRAQDLDMRFLSILDNNDDHFIAEEVESYQFEHYFQHHLERFFDGGFNPQEIEDMRLLLMKRKAIQYNLHLLANELTYSFYKGIKVDRISSIFQKKITLIYPRFTFSRSHEWVKYANLDQPLSRLGYLRAYEKVFG